LGQDLSAEIVGESRGMATVGAGPEEEDEGSGGGVEEAVSGRPQTSQ
jgi:hypothetical protein